MFIAITNYQSNERMSLSVYGIDTIKSATAPLTGNGKYGDNVEVTAFKMRNGEIIHAKEPLLVIHSKLQALGVIK